MQVLVVVTLYIHGKQVEAFFSLKEAALIHINNRKAEGGMPIIQEF